MKRFLCLVTAAMVVTSCHAEWNYPATKTVDVSDTYFGKPATKTSSLSCK